MGHWDLGECRGGDGWGGSGLLVVVVGGAEQQESVEERERGRYGK